MNHPLDYFSFCPHCGSNSFDINNFKSKKCHECGFVYYLNPSAACAAFVIDEKGRLLVAIRKNNPGKGKFDLPGGFSDADETSEFSILRELEEEVGSAIVKETASTIKYLFSVPNQYQYSGMDIPTMDLIYEFRVKDLDNYVGKGIDDVEELIAISLSSINIADFAFISIRNALKRYLANYKHQ